MNNDEVLNQIEEKSQEIHRLEDELNKLDYNLIKNVQNLNSVDETHDDGTGWGTVILAILFGWMFGD